MSKRPNLEELNVLDDFLLNAIANDPDVGEPKWSMLPDLYMIMITTFDPFGGDSMVYTFENICREDPDLEYGDGLKFIYFNITGKKNVAQAQKELLTYLNRSKIESVTNDQVAHIHDYVRHVKQSAEVRERYMTIGEMMDMSKEEGRAEGMVEGQRLGLKNLILGVLSELGPIPEELQARLEPENKETLIQWAKFAARAESIEEFLEQI